MSGWVTSCSWSENTELTPNASPAARADSALCALSARISKLGSARSAGMWAVAAQPRLGLTPMIPTPSFDGVEVTRTTLSYEWAGARSGDRGLAGRDGLDSQLDPGRLADEEAAGFESHVPGEPEVLTVDLGGRAEADALVAHGGGATTVEVDLQGDGPGRAAHGQVAHELPGVVAQWLHRC